MNCNKCGCEVCVNGLVQHENKCNLTKDDVKIIINEYINNFLSTSEIEKKYKLSHSVVRRILGNKIRSFSESISVSHKMRPRKISNETKKKLSIWRIQYLKDNPDKIKWVGNESVPSMKFKEILTQNNISFVEEFKPLEDRFFNIDISFPDKKIGIEINGEQHYERNGKLKKYYQDRHNLIENNGWKLYEIHTSLIYKKEFIDDIILELKNNFNLEGINYEFYKKDLNENVCLCGSKILRNSKMCLNCYNKLSKKRKVERPTYDVLLKEIDEIGYSGTGRKYRVSGNSIKKWVKMYEKHGINY